MALMMKMKDKFIWNLMNEVNYKSLEINNILIFCIEMINFFFLKCEFLSLEHLCCDY